MFMKFQECGGVLQVAALALATIGLDFAELDQGFLELSGEAQVMHAESGEGAVGVDDVEFYASLLGGRVGAAVKKSGFEQGDAIEAPGRVGQFLGELVSVGVAGWYSS